MLFRKQPQPDLRTRLIDDLLEASAHRRLEIIHRGIQDGTIKPAEADEMLRLVVRLESVLRAGTTPLPNAVGSSDRPRYVA